MTALCAYRGYRSSDVDRCGGNFSNPLQLEKVYPLLPTVAQNVMVTIAGANFARKKYGKGFSRFLARIEESQWWSKDQLLEYQSGQLKNLVDFAYSHSRYYRKTFDTNGIKPQDIKGVEDLTRIPVLTKNSLHNHLDEISPLHRNDLRLERHHTSGTTGAGMHLYWDRSAITKEYSFVARHRRWAGINPFDRQATFGGRIVVPVSRKRPPFWRRNLAENQILFSMYHVTKGNAPDYLAEIRKFRPRFIQGYPSMISTLARLLREKGSEAIGIDAIFTSSETLTDYQRRVIEEVFKCKVYDWYGCTELAGSICQCEKGSYHVNSEYGIVEVQPSEAEGCGQGEMICTSFVNLGTPLIRYAVGDLVRESDLKCPCGRGLPVVNEILGRCDDIVVTPSGAYLGRLDHIFKDSRQIEEAQVIQESTKELTVLLVPRRPLSTQEIEDLRNQFVLRTGPEMRIAFEITDGIPRESNGKFRSVVSKIRK